MDLFSSPRGTRKAQAQSEWNSSGSYARNPILLSLRYKKGRPAWMGTVLLTLVAGLLSEHRLDAVLIGSAAAALQGSPVTTFATRPFWGARPTRGGSAGYHPEQRGGEPPSGSRRPAPA